LHAGSPHEAGRRTPRRWAVAVLATITLSTLFVLAPAPRWAVAEEMDVHSTRVELARTRADRSGQAVATTGLDAADAARLRAARRDASRVTTGVRASAVRAVGVTVDRAPEGPVLLRGRVDGVWTPWFEVPFADGEAPDAPPGVAIEPARTSEPVWLGDADAYELDAPAAMPAIEVHEVVVGRTERRIAAGDAAGAAGTPTILSRSSWGARAPRATPSVTADLKVAIVHHSVTGNTYSASQVPSILRSIQAYHMDANGWNDIAYNFVVDRFGRIWEGRAGGIRNVVLGGHSQGFNTGSTGVVLLGDYRTAGVTSAAFEAIARVIAWKLALHRVDPLSTVPVTSAGSAKYAAGHTVVLPRVVGHGDVQATSCPGTNLAARLPALRSRVTQLVPTYQAGLGPLLLGPDLTGDGLTDPLEYRPGAGTDTTWRATASGSFVKTRPPVSGAYRPAVGDFDGNGRDDVLWHATGSAGDRIWWSSSAGRTSQAVTVTGSYVPIVGDFDGNQVDDVYWYAPGLAPDTVWYFNKSRGHASLRVRQDLITGVPITGDFDGDGRDDIVFYGPGPDADDQVWWSNGQSWRIVSATVNGRYSPAAHDANGDGRDEVTWVAQGASTSHRWVFAGRTRTTISFSHTPVTGLPQVGDFDDDGREDLLLIAPGTAADRTWYSTNTGIDARTVSVVGTYAITTGDMDAPTLALRPSTDDVLLVSNGSDHLWQGQANRSFISTRVG
jgi:hypothetical protein